MPTKSVNTFLNGLNVSIDNVNQPKDTYSYALNTIKEDSINNPEIITNEKGFTTYIDLGYNYVLLGTIYLGKKDYIYFIKNEDSDTNIFNRIILVENNTFSISLDNNDLNFNSNNIIKGTYRINYKNERIIYWVDGFNKDRVLNIDNGIAITDISELSLDIDYLPAILQDKIVNDDNGNLLTGAYEFFASYKTKDNAVTPWFILNAKPIYIIEAATQNLSPSEYINVDGVDSNVLSTKSIQLDIANLDQNFTTLRIGILKTINGNTTGYYIDNISYSTTTKSYTYSGFDTEILVPNIADFTTDIVRYYGSNAIIQSNNRLVRANTKATKIDIEYQSFANNIEVDYYVDEDLVLTMPDSIDYTVRSNWWKNAATKYTDEQTLMRDEQYSLGIAIGLIKEGIETEVYHIPGRKLNDIPISVYQSEFKDVPTVAYSSTWDSQIITDNGDSVPRWKVQNTGACSTDGRIKKLAYWESDNKYPDGFGFPITGSTNNGTNNTNIRHHKIPSSNIEPIYRTETISGNINVYKRNIGLTFSNIEVPDSLKDNIAYIRIYITPRNLEQNKSVIAKGIFTNCAYTRIFSYGDVTHTPSSNYYIAPVMPYNDLDDQMNNLRFQNIGVIDGDTNTDNNHYHSFYSPDTLLKNPAINADRVYIENEITGIVHYYNTVSTKINVDPAKPGHTDTDSSANGGYKRDLFYSNTNGALIPTLSSTSGSGDVYNVANIFKSTYKSIAILNEINKVSSGKVSRKAKKAVYVPFNAQLSTDQLGGMDNPYYSPYGAANVLVELDPNNSVLGATEALDTSVNFIDNNSAYNNLERTADHGLTTNGTFHFHTIQNPQVVYRYGSIKRTNPVQYGNIDGLNYIPTDLVVATPQFDINNKLTISLSGLIGDSYIDIFSVKRTRFGAKTGYTYGGLPEVSIGISSFFTEAQTNLRLRYAEEIDPKVYYPKILLTVPPLQYLDWGNSPNIVNSDNYYKENTDFDSISLKENFGVSLLDIQTAGLIEYPTRLVYSEQLLNETSSDAYRVFLANNYLDLTKNTGFITHLFNKQQELYAVTRDSIWRLFASNQTIKSDSNENITVGTGEFLANEPVEILSIEGGYAGSSSKASLVETPYGYFYCDRYKGRFILFDGQQKDIALKGINEFTKDNFDIEIIKQIKELDTDFDSPLFNYGYLAGYEPENNRILITKLDYKFTTETFPNYKGIYNPDTTYNNGDIYLRNGILYTFNNSTTQYEIIEQNSNLSDFTPSTVNPIVFTLSNPSHGTAIVAPTDSTKVLYTPTTNYIGSDTFNITVGCNTTEVDVTIQDAPTVPNYTDNLPETSSNSTVVQTVVGTYSGHTLTYSILSGNTYNIFSINSSTGVITVTDNTYLNYDLVQQVILNIQTIADDSKIANSTVTINITRLVQEPTHSDATITISKADAIGTLEYTIPQASYPHPPSPYSSLIYSVLSESNPGTFISDLSDPTNMTVKVGTILPTSPQNYSITYHAEDNVNSSQFVNFTLYINYNPAAITANVSEASSPYADVNLQIKDNGTILDTITGSGTTHYSIGAGHNVSFETFATAPSTGINPTITMQIIKDGVTVYGPTTIPSDTGASLVYNETVTTESNYIVNSSSHADPIIYHSIEKSGVANRNNCDTNYVGTPVTYTVIAGTYTSTISQADADAQAQADVDANKQTYANTHGTCLAPATVSWQLTEQNSPSIYVDSDLIINDNGTNIVTALGTDSGSFVIIEGHTLLAAIRSTSASMGTNPKLRLIVKRDSTTIFDNITAQTSTSEIDWTESAISGSHYQIIASSYSDAVITWTLTQSSTPVIPENLTITDITGTLVNTNTDSSNTFSVSPNDLISAIVTAGTPVGATTPKQHLFVTSNGGVAYDTTIDSTVGATQTWSDNVIGGYYYTITASSYDTTPPVPVCPDRALVFEICNSNAERDDNFDIYLNGTYIGAVDLSTDALVGSVFIASLSTPTITSTDFVCPISDMVAYYFDPSLVVGGTNTIHMVNTRNNGDGNFGTVGVRNYLISGDTLSSPCVVTDLTYSGDSGSSFELPFSYTACCPGD